MGQPRVTPPGDDIPRFRLGWRASFALGLVTLVLGAILMTRPTHSLTVIAILLGVVMVVSGVFHLVRALDGRESERVWRGISGVLFVIAGLALIRHLHLSLALMGLFVGFSWVIQGVSALAEGISRRDGSRRERGWALFFGVISLVAGIVVISSPIASIAALTFFMGAWFIVMGLLEMIGSLLARRRDGPDASGPVDLPGQRATRSEAGADQKTSRSSRE